MSLDDLFLYFTIALVSLVFGPEIITTRSMVGHIDRFLGPQCCTGLRVV